MLAVSIATVSAAFLSLFEGASTAAVVWTFFITFGVAYILTQIAMRFFIFREIKKTKKGLEKLRKGDFVSVNPPNQQSWNPFRMINEEIYSYAAVKQQEIDELKKLAAFRREFLADVAHELKTPLFAAQGFVLTLLDGAVEDKTVRDRFLKKAAKSLQGLEIMIEDLFTISQMESGELKMNFQAFDLCDTLKEAIDQFESKADKKGISLEYHCPGSGNLIAYGDPQRICQALTNLVSNAIKYNKPGGYVRIYLKETRADATVFIQDNGVGIPQQDIKRIFERFYRVDKSRSKEKGGSGLGLAIVKHILEAHKSAIQVTSVLGEGSTFSFTLKKQDAVSLK